MKKITIILVLILLLVVLGISGCTSFNINKNVPTNNVTGVQLKVSYKGPWQGAYGEMNALGPNINLKQVEGKGNETYNISGNLIGIIAMFNKLDSTSRPLTLELTKDGKIINSQTTTASYGSVAIEQLFP